MQWISRILRTDGQNQTRGRKIDTSSIDNSLVYHGLPVNSDSIRLVKITEQGQLKLEVFSRALAKQTTYYGISYCWAGSPQDSIWLCNGTQFLLPRTIDNLFQHCIEAVKTMRSQFRGRNWSQYDGAAQQPMAFIHTNHSAEREADRYPWLWIDQICINQASQSEKLVQIGLMGFIYSQSKQTIVWLGTGSKSDVEELRFLALNRDERAKDDQRRYQAIRKRKILLSRSRNQEYHGIQLSSKDTDYTIHRTEMIDEIIEARKLIKAFEKLLSLPWFGRIWVVQEVALSPQRPIAVFGSLMMDWEKLVGVLIFEKQPIDVTHLENLLIYHNQYIMDEELWNGMREVTTKFPKALFNMRAFAQLPGLTKQDQEIELGITDLLLMTPCFEATVVHDRINGLLALARETSDPGPLPRCLTVNYNWQFSEWSIHMTRYIIHTSQQLRIWSLLRDTPRFSDWPSWVVDLGDSSPNLLFFADSCKCKFPVAMKSQLPKRLPTQLNNDRILVVRGECIDTVDKVCPDLSSRGGVAESWKQYQHHFASHLERSDFTFRALFFLWVWLMEEPRALRNFSGNSGHFNHDHDNFVHLNKMAEIRGLCSNLLEAFQEVGETTGHWVDELKYNLHLSHASEFTDADIWGHQVSSDPKLEKYRRFTQHHLKTRRRISMMRGHSIFWTSHGWNLGRGSRRARPGDLICRIDGGYNLIILRPTETPGHFALIGPCYITNRYRYEGQKVHPECQIHSRELENNSPQFIKEQTFCLI